MDLKSILIDQKIFESIEEVEDFYDQQELDDETCIQSLVFDKSVFESAAEAIEWASTHCFFRENIEETEDSFIITQFDVTAFDPTSVKMVDIRRGIKATVGVFIQDSQSSDLYLSLKNADNSIKFSADIPSIIEVARVVKGFHANYGEVEITQEHLESFLRNFKERVIGVDLMVDIDHNQAEAAGWIRDLYLSLDKQTLLAVVKWNPKGAVLLQDRIFRYFSPEFTLQYVHPHTGDAHGATLLGGALVNRPFLKMDAIVSLKEQNQENQKPEESMSEKNEQVLSLEKQIEEFKMSEAETVKTLDGLKKELTESKEENVKLSEKMTKMEDEQKKAELDAKHEKLFTENKINKAQLDALKSGKDYLDVLELSENMNTDATGSDKTGNEDVVVLSEEEKAFCAKMGISEEDYVKYNK